MKTDRSSLIIPFDLIEQLESDIDRYEISTSEALARAYVAGADQELEACCKWLPKLPPWSADDLRKHRRPKLQSLKELALQALKHAEEGWRPVLDDCALIRRALETLPD